MTDLNKIALVGSYVPRQCGIATFSKDLHDGIRSVLPAAESLVVAVSDVPVSGHYPDEVRFEIVEQDPVAYQRAADYLNYTNVDVVSLQHEFGIFGGPDGAHVLSLLRRLKMPVVTTLHTVVATPTSGQRRVMQEIVSLSSRLVVMSDHGRNLLRETYGVAANKVETIHHGIPDVPCTDRVVAKRECGLEGKRVLLTFGLLSPNKGVEHVIQALPDIIREFPNTVYVVVGTTHPNLRRTQGEAYRDKLETLAAHLGVRENVMFVNRYVDLAELSRFLRAADIYLTPYLSQVQSSSGTLAYALGCGNAVISTPYWHAEELLADGRGVLVPFADPPAIAKEARDLLRNDERRAALQKSAYALGREMIWTEVAARYIEAFDAARRARSERRLSLLQGRGGERPQGRTSLPRLDHLVRLTDSTGLLQHASFSIPKYAEGYCTDDNARALILTTLLEGSSADPRLESLQTIYASFLAHAFNPATRRFRNFMGFDRAWLESEGAEDSQGRALWALGTVVGRSKRQDLRSWGVPLFDAALPELLETRSPRAWAFALLGVLEYQHCLDGDRRAAQARTELELRLITAYRSCIDGIPSTDPAQEPWCWFEDVLAYDNARLPQALIASGRRRGGAKLALDIGLSALRWLVEVQTSDRGHLRPIGSRGFYRRGGPRAIFDQQPIDAQATLAACREAYHATGDGFWLMEARRAFDWFVGHNDLGIALGDASGGCRDGLMVDRTNGNQGAESTLAFLLAATDLTQLDAATAVPAVLTRPTAVDGPLPFRDPLPSR